MKIVVCAKRAGVLGDDIEFTDDHRDVDPDYLDFALNEWDACALEEAIRMRDAGGGGEVLVLTVGEADSERELRRCLAMGADRAIRIWSDDLLRADPIVVAHALAEVIEREDSDLVLCGAQSGDSMQGATGAALGAFLGMPVVAVVNKIEYDPAARTAVVHRELEGGLVDVTEIRPPAVLTVQTGINEPRYVTMRAMQEAAERDIELRTPVATIDAAYRVRRMFALAKRRAVMIEGEPKELARRILEVVREAMLR